MNMIVCALAGASFAVSVPAAAQPNVQVQLAAEAQPDAGAKLVEARAIVDVILPPEGREQMFRDLVAKFSAQFNAAMGPGIAGVDDPGLNKIMDDFRAKVPDIVMPVLTAHMPQITSAMATAYVHEFSLAELKDIHAFAQTPAGAHYLSRSAYIIGDPVVGAANTAYLSDLKATAEKEGEVLKDQLTAYLKAHPDVAKKISDKSGQDR